MRPNFQKTISLFLLIFSIQAFSFANNPEIAKKSIFQAFNSSDIQEITIEANITTILNNKRSKEYQPGRLSYIDDKGEQQVFDIKLKPRGKYRRVKCDFPPLKVKFRKKALEAKHFKTFNKLKLVTHCNDQDLDQQSVLKEYQTYKLYNLLTERSFKVQLLKINYIDADGSSMQRYGFFIESEEELAERLNGKLYETFNTPNDSLEVEQKNLLSVFQFMIGNSDWHVQRLKNVALIETKESQGFIPVPYDFDFAGLVDAPYAKPSPDYPIKDVKDRIFLGQKIESDEMESVRIKLEEQRKILIESCSNFDLLDKPVRKEMIRYINSFYKIIDQKEKWTSL